MRLALIYLSSVKTMADDESSSKEASQRWVVSESCVAEPGVFSSPGVYAWVDDGCPQKAPLMRLRSIASIANPAVNGWVRENLIKQHNIQTLSSLG